MIAILVISAAQLVDFKVKTVDLAILTNRIYDLHRE
jgi:hypothetical protein